MTSLVLGAIGAGIGYAVGPVTLMGMSSVSIGWSIGSTIGSLIDGGSQKAPTSYGPRLGDLKVQSSTYGQPIPRVYGSFRCAGNMIWSLPIKETVHKKKVKAGGKGGGKKKATQITYSYSQTFAIAICEGPIIGIRRIWANGSLIYDVGDSASAESLVASNAMASGITIYSGNESQLPNSTIQADVGASNCPAYRGVAYVVFHDLQLERFGNRTPNVEFEVMQQAPVLQSRLVASSVSGSISVGNIGKSGSMVHATNISSTTEGATRTYSYSKYQIDYSGIPKLLKSFPFLTRTVPPEQPIFWTRVRFMPEAYLVLLGYSGSDCALLIDGEFGGSIPGAQLGSSYGVPQYAIAAYGYVYARWASSNNISRMALSGGSADLVSTAGYSEMIVDEDGYLFGRIGSSIWKLDENLNQIGGPWTITFSVPVTLIGKDGNDWYLYDTYYSSTPRTHRVPDGFGYSIHQDNRIEHWWSQASNFTYVAPGLIVGYSVSIPGWAWVSMLPSIQFGSVSVRDIVEAECAKVGLSGSKIDATALTDTLTGYAITSRGTVRAGLEPLASCFFFDGIEVDGTLKFVKRGGSIAASIPEDDLAAHEWGSDQPDTALMERAQDVELPDEVTLNYMDKDADYMVGTQYARRLIGSSRSQRLVSFAMALSASQAKSVADVLMFNAWQGRVSFSFSTSLKYSFIVPGDVVSVSKGDAIHTVRILTRDEQRGVIRFDAVLEDLQVYDQSAPASSIPVQPNDIELDGPTSLSVLDIPLLHDTDDGYEIYTAAHGHVSGWSGAQIFKSADGASWSEFGTVHLVAATAGFATSVLGPFSQNIFDESNSVTVTLISGELFSATEADVLNGDNAALLGNEIIQFKNATLVSGSTWLLSGLLRGRKGTEWAVSTHAVGERFVLLEPETIIPQQLALGELNMLRLYRGVTFGTLVDDAADVPFTFTGVSMRPYAPVLLGGGRDASGNLTIKWVRRTRIGGEWKDFADVPLGEDAESYEVEIWDGTFSTLKRTIGGLSSPTCTYSATDQVTDFGAVQATVYCRVYQLSAQVGRGYKLEGSV